MRGNGVRASVTTVAERLLPDGIVARIRPFARKADAILFDKSNEALAQRIALLAFVIRVVSAAIALVSQVILARLMGSYEYGIFVFVWTAMVIVGDITCLGYQTSVIRFIPQYRERNESDLLRGLHRGSRLVVFAVSSVAALAGYCFVTWFPESLDAVYLQPFLIGLALLPLIAMSDLMSGIARAQGWALLALAPVYLVRPLLILAVLIIVIMSGFDASGATAIWSALVATAITTAGTMLITEKGVDREIEPGPRRYDMRHWLLVSLPIFLVEGFYFILTNADVLMVGWYMEPDDVAVYFAAVKILALVHFVYFAVRAGAAQRFSTLLHSDDPEELARFARQTVTWTFWPSLAMALVMLVAGDFLLSLFGAGFVDGHELMAILCVGIIARAAVGPSESLLTMAGHERVCALAYGGALAVNLTLNMVLIPAYGLMGAAIATAIALCVEAVLLSYTVKRRLGITMMIASPLLGLIRRAQ